MRWNQRAVLGTAVLFGLVVTPLAESWAQSCNVATGGVAAATVGNAESCHGDDGGSSAYGKNAGNAGAASPVGFSNNDNVNETYLGLGQTPQQPVFLFSTGGNGGNVAPKTNNNGSIDYDGNGNPQYGGGTGGSGGDGGMVSLTNTGTVSLTTNGSQFSGGAYLVEGLSSGGRGGNGTYGAIGGAANNVTVTDTGNVGLYWTWTGPSAASIGLADVAALSQGGQGNQSLKSGHQGGVGGAAGNAAVTISGGSTLYLAESNYDVNSHPFFAIPGTEAALAGAGALALAQGGNGGSGYDTSAGGAGGIAGTAMAMLTNVNIRIDNPYDPTDSQGSSNLAGALAASKGGNGGVGGLEQNHDPGGNGGQAGAATATLTGTLQSQSAIYTNAYYAPGMVVNSTGGNGGDGTNYTNYAFNAYGGDGGAGGAGAASTATLEQYSGVTTEMLDSPAIAASSVGGQGGAGGAVGYAFGDVDGFSGNGGAGGSAGAVMVTLDATSGIYTAQYNSPGIYALSQGGDGGSSGGTATFIDAGSGNGGVGGNAGDVTVSLAANSNINTMAMDSSGVVAQSFSGGGGTVGSAGGTVANSGAPGAGGNAGNVTVTNAGFIYTNGQDSRGISAQSSAGAGGTTGDTGGVLTHTQNGGAGGNVGSAKVINTGGITTAGAGAYAIEVQSIGGGGGGGGDNASAFQIGGNNGMAGASNGGMATAENSGTIITTGDEAGAVLVQGIGGGGGDGGSSGVIVSIGGTGGSGGNGGVATVTGDAGSTINTLGDLGFGLMAQSIGGGGGTGGNALAIAPIFTIGIAGSGGGGGNALASTVNSAGSITTQGQRADGIVAQSVGGGGGSGGDASSYTVGLVSVAVGGAGGGGGNGSTATVNATAGGDVQVSGTDSSGIVAESVGGGGGMGGNGYGQTVGLGFSASVAVGGSGGMGGAGASAIANLTGTSVSTGLSINAIPAIPTPADDLASGAAVAPGDPAGSPDYYEPLPTDSYGVVAQSVGGGGGMGGSGMAQAFTADFPIPESDTSVGVASATGVGGDGAIGGAGGTAMVSLSNGTTILTNGAGSHAVVAQSVGGGGGIGGDASAQSSTFGFKDISALTGRKNFNLDLSVTNGGGGGSGNAGGDATVVVGGTAAGADPAGDAPVTITTYGDDADAIYAESIGGGGGDAGFGSGSTQNFTSAATALTATISVGSSGGSGGAGGAVNVSIDPGADITTYGSSSDGVYAHSIGGGGGDSAGGSYSFGLPPVGAILAAAAEGKPAFLAGFGSASNVTLNVGEAGGTGGNGGSVTVNDAGAYPAYTHITTLSDDADGIYAQSVGGGGGTAGSAGSDGSSDNPYLSAAGAKKAVDLTVSYLLNLAAGFKALYPGETEAEIGASVSKAFGGAALKTFLPKLKLTLSIGAHGGAGGNGGLVTVDLNTAYITTSGDYADALVGQSVGGGGGQGGAAIAGGSTGLGALLNVDLNFALGGGGGSGGTGGPVNITLGNNAVSTHGFAAYGIVGQSVGGGGGLAGSAETVPDSGIISLGGTVTEAGGLARDGGAVTLNEGANGNNNITTAGDAADAILLQSIGGGGGAAGAGATISGGIAGEGNISAASGTLQLAAGGNSGANGNGGAVSIDNTYLMVSTSGANASGIVAQSIGGGGGLVAVVANDSTQNPDQTQVVYQLGGQTSQAANGGAVTIDQTFAGANDITTTGDGSDGIIAQSIGGGGGIDGYAAGATTLNLSPAPARITSGNGGPVSITLGSSSGIYTSGASADGIFAQSIGGGGGIMPSADGTQIIAGSTGAAGSAGIGGAVTVTQGGILSASGENAIGIFAQSVGANGQGSNSSITVNGSVAGGSGSDGYGVVMDGDAANSILVGTTGSVSAQSGMAMLVTGNGTTKIENAGTIDGDVDAGSYPASPDLLTNDATGVLISHGAYQIELANNGTLETDYTGNLINTQVATQFTQSADGIYQPHIDFDNAVGEALDVDGTAFLSGHIQPILVGDTDASGVNKAVTVVSVTGAVLGLAGAPPIVADNSSVATYSAYTSFNSEVVALTAVNLATPAANLSVNESGVARHLQNIFDKGRSAFSPLFTQLLNAAAQNTTNYKAQISAMTAGASLGNGARTEADLQNFGDSLMSCPVFSGDGGFLQEASCVWARGIDRGINESSYTGDPGFSVQESGMQIGGQKEVTPGWFFGGALAYGQSWMTSTDGDDKSHGNFGNAGLVVKHEYQNWLFAAGIYGGYGQYNATRYLRVPNYQATAYSTPSTAGAGVRLRAAYTAAFGNSYLRPSFSLDGIYAVTPGYAENNGGLLAIAYKTSGKFLGVGTPNLEAGQRINLPAGNTLRIYASAGVSLLSSSRWEQDARFESEPVDSGYFSTSLPLDTATGRFQAGAQLIGSNAWSLRLEYDGAISQHVTSHSGILVASTPF